MVLIVPGAFVFPNRKQNSFLRLVAQAAPAILPSRADLDMDRGTGERAAFAGQKVKVGGG